MPVSRPHDHTRNTGKPCRKPLRAARFRLCYRRERWAFTTDSKWKCFDSLSDAIAYVRRLLAWERQSGGQLHARLDQRDARTGRWVEVPELGRLLAESGWPK